MTELARFARSLNYIKINNNNVLIFSTPVRIRMCDRVSVTQLLANDSFCTPVSIRVESDPRLRDVDPGMHS